MLEIIGKIKKIIKKFKRKDDDQSFEETKSIIPQKIIQENEKKKE